MFVLTLAILLYIFFSLGILLVLVASIQPPHKKKAVFFF